MSTRARIGLELSDGSILSAYHHFDGYPQWLGKTLVENFTTYETVSELIDGGDMSVCVTDKDEEEQGAPRYYSARGESCPPRLDPSLGAYCDKDNGEEYHYVFKPVNNKLQWVCIDQHQWDGTDKQPEVVAIPA